MSLTVSPVAAYILVFTTVIVVCILTNILHKPSMRSCPQCGKPVRMDARRCRRCRYRFSAV
jgi:predicted amidophosphoribosyltransferase